MTRIPSFLWLIFFPSIRSYWNGGKFEAYLKKGIVLARPVMHCLKMARKGSKLLTIYVRGQEYRFWMNVVLARQNNIFHCQRCLLHSFWEALSCVMGLKWRGRFDGHEKESLSLIFAVPNFWISKPAVHSTSPHFFLQMRAGIPRYLLLASLLLQWGWLVMPPFVVSKYLK